MISLFIKQLIMITDSHSHRVFTDGALTLYNLRLNDEPLTLPHGPDLYFSVGIHPLDAHRFQTQWIDQMSMLLTFQQVLAVGECGLDKNIELSLQEQIRVFERQIDLSEYHNKPLIIHCVGCYNELLVIKKERNPKQAWIIHGFRGKPQLAEQLLLAGFYLSYGEHFNAASVALTPLARLLVESDESTKDLSEIYTDIAKARNCQVEELNIASQVFKFNR